MKAKEVMNILGISRQTLVSYHKKGLIKVTVLPNGRYNYDDDSVYEFVGRKKERKERLIVSYARVSTQQQKSQLESQESRIYDGCLSRGIVLDKQYKDIKSGMSANRKDFQQLLNDVISNKIELIVIENKDRLIRFGYEILESIFRYFGTKILVLNDNIDNKSYEQELTEDLIFIINYFTTKSCSHRRKLNKLKKELESK